MGSLSKVTTVLSHFILTLLTGPRQTTEFWAQIHYILIAMNQGLSQSGLNLNSATHSGPPWTPRPSANQRPELWQSDQSEAWRQEPWCRNHQGEIFVRMAACLTQIPRLYWVLIMSKLNICQMLQPGNALFNPHTWVETLSSDSCTCVPLQWHILQTQDCVQLIINANNRVLTSAVWAGDGAKMDHVHVIFCLRPQVPINKADTRSGQEDGA